MSFTLSPQQDIQALLGRRSLTIIPKDQQNILDKDGSWAVETNQRQGQPPVPSHVLETIKEAFLLGQKHKSKLVNNNELPETVQPNDEGRRDESVEKRGTVNANDLPETIQCSHVDRIVESIEDQVKEEERGAGEDQHSDDQSSTSSRAHSRLTSWSPSPDRDAQKRPTTPSQSQAVQETPIPNPRPGLLNRLPQSQPPPPTVSAVEEEDEEDEMDMQLPQAHEQPDPRINLASTRLQATSTPAINIASQVAETETPPCAQPNQNVIPNTVETNRVSAPVEPGIQQKRLRRFKRIELEGTTPLKPVNASTSFTRLPNMFRIAEVGSSLSTSSSSLIPATCSTASTQHSTAAAPPPPSSLSLPDPNNHEPRSLTSPTAHIATETEFEAHSVNRRISPGAASNPYTIFTTTYPSYPFQNGTPKNFITACVCLAYLDSKRSLREFLYDDFIRAFAAGYVKYATRARGGQKPLPADEWFNRLPGEPEYRKMVITRQNLQHVLDAFPDEVARAGRIVHGTSESGNEKIVGRREKQLGRDDVANAHVQTPDMSPPRPAKRQRPSPPSPQLGSDAPDPPDGAPPPPVRPKTPGPSHYFERSGAQKWRFSEERKARLLEYLKNKKASSTLGPRSRHSLT